MADKVYALAIHYRGKCKKLKNIDPNKYSYIDFVADIKEVHAVGDEIVFKITCTMDDSNVTMNICNDFDVLSMFSRNENRVEFDVFVEVIEFIEKGHDYENVEGDSNGEGDEWIDENGEDTGGRGSENESDDENISEDESVGEDSGDELSDYKSDDHCEPNNFSDSEFEDDPLHGSLNRDACTLPCQTGQKVKLEKGMVFVDINAFRKVLKEFVIQEGFKVMRMRNEKKKKRVTSHCSVKDCPWRVHVSPLADGVNFQVKTYVPNHTCVRSDPTKEASAEWIASKIESVLRENPGMKARGIRNELKKFGVNPQYMQINRAKKKAMESIEGSYAESFGRMSYYADLVLEKNEGSVVTLQCDVDETEPIHSTPIFKRFFLGLSALRDGFLEGCSPFLGFDGCHLKGPFGGVLLAAIGLDGNNGRFPVAFAVVESKCKDSWTFFVENLSMLVEGLVETINDVVPHAINRRCARHIYANFRSQFAGTTLKRVWDISGIPCRHAALGISHRREDLDSYCDSRFFKENYMKAYKYSIHPVLDQTLWPYGLDVTPTLLPPIIKRMPRRPKKSRRKEQVEEPNAIRRSNMVKCKVCNELGHNRRTCPNIQVQNSGRDSDLHVPLSKLARKRKTPPLAGRKRKAAVISSPATSTSTSFILPAFAQERSCRSFNACCRFILTAATTLISSSNISTTKLLERHRSLSSQGNKEQET
ncbi:hypothetical protein Sango_2066300 [Sesamum angolense]|uniref:Transposase MuDR plant domain-containing protein n=1 Tax=Sesamum angolense TaxID=2727404 RepID=A0AAE1WB07_9LAMI|nr:hypothetical protein Sango_2066300 [Sesamum angolense]